jgi:hypothetical protein
MSQPAFAQPELPSVCFKCGRAGLFKAYEVTYTRTTTSGWTAVTIFLGFSYHRTLTYRPQVPLCDACAATHGRPKRAMLLAFAFTLLSLLPAGKLAEYFSIQALFALPMLVLMGGYAYSRALERRCTPKAVTVTPDALVLEVPGYGRLALYGQDPKADRRATTQRQEAAPKLNRSVCEGCGFINFPNVLECKKCHAPLGQTVTV